MGIWIWRDVFVIFSDGEIGGEERWIFRDRWLVGLGYLVSFKRKRNFFKMWKVFVGGRGGCFLIFIYRDIYIDKSK